LSNSSNYTKDVVVFFDGTLINHIEKRRSNDSHPFSKMYLAKKNIMDHIADGGKMEEIVKDGKLLI